MSPQETHKILLACQELIQDEDYSPALDLLDQVLNDDPNNAPALNFSGYIAMKQRNDSMAYQLLKRAAQEEPRNAKVLTNYGLAAHHLGRDEESIQACLRAAEMLPSYAMAYTNAASAMIAMSQWKDAQKCSELAIEINNDPNSRMNMAHCLLAQHKWVEGWKYWELSVGSIQRKEWSYGDEPRWNGDPGKNIIIYGEQGLGDEVFFGSCIPDAVKASNHVIIDCDPKLEGLFRRSFPEAEVHGTRRENMPAWLDGTQIDARVSVGSLPQFYRHTDSDFPGTPYLVADPERRLMWRALFDSLGKPIYGITSQGGHKYTNAKGRNIPVEAFAPIFEQDAIFICLDYRDEITHPKLRQYPSIVKSMDYDDQAALIAELDAVIGVNTTAMHVANALGTKTHMLIPTGHQWRYSWPQNPYRYVWSKTARLYHQAKGEPWANVVKRVKL